MICLNEGTVRDCTGRQWIVPAGPAGQLFGQIIDQNLKKLKILKVYQIIDQNLKEQKNWKFTK